VLIDEVRNIPLPEPTRVKLEGLASQAEIDVAAFDAFGLNDAERVLVEDLVNEIICEFRSGATRLGKRTVDAVDDGRETVLSEYCGHVMRVIKAGFGADHIIRATIFSPRIGQKPLPYRLVGLHLCESGDDAIRIEPLESGALLERMENLDRLSGGKRRGLYDGRTLRMYDGRTNEPTIFILKPDVRRHWLRSVALEDGDEIALDLFRWQQGAFTAESLRG
jgi:hypothetical protein